MKRSELTYEKMIQMGWEALNVIDLPISTIIENIKKKNEDGTWYWQLKCEMHKRQTRRDYTMCSTYKVLVDREYLLMSTDNKSWYKIAKREKEIGRQCIYAD